MLQYFKMAFLEIQNVTTWSVFVNPVTFLFRANISLPIHTCKLTGINTNTHTHTHRLTQTHTDVLTIT